MALLNDLEAALKKAGYAASIKASGGAQSPNVVAVELENDEDGRQRGLLLTLASSVIASMQASGELDAEDAENDNFDFLQFYVALPFSADSAYFPAAAQLIAHINKSMPLMGFNLDALTSTVNFRTTMIFEAEALNTTLVLEIVRTIVFLLSRFSDRLEAVATGAEILDDALAKLN